MLFLYLLIINAVSFLLMLADKKRATKKRWRIPERVLIGTAIAGGSLGTLLAMNLFHHKTKKQLFYAGIPLLFLLQSFLLIAKLGA